MLDEAQNVGSGLGLVAEMAARLRAHNRWMVSGTPLSTGGLADIQARSPGTARVGRRSPGSGGLTLLSDLAAVRQSSIVAPALSTSCPQMSSGAHQGS